MSVPAEIVASFLEEYLPGGWTSSVYNDRGTHCVTMQLVITDKQLREAAYRPGDFLAEITPHKDVIAKALAQRPRMRFVGPYASRAILRRKADL